MKQLECEPEKITFKNGDITVAGNLYLPNGRDNNIKYPAVIVGHPAGGVKEQAAGLYASKLAENGFITLAFDASHQGESGGDPRYLEDPAKRVSDFNRAMDYLTIQSQVDANRIGVMGICGGAGFVVSAARDDNRFKAVVTISGVDLGKLRREGLGGSFPVDYVEKTLKEVAFQKECEAKGEAPRYNTYVPVSMEVIPESAPVMYREGFDYYMTERAYHPNTGNKYLFTSLELLFQFTGFDRIETISPRPLLFIAGSTADTLYFSQQAYDAAMEPKELFIIDGASHIDLYDKPEYVTPVVEKLIAFYTEFLR